MSPSSDREEEVFAQALERPAAERAAYLDQACGGADDLRARVAALLQAHDAAGGFLETPIPEGLAGVAEAARQASPLEEAVGAVIGRYRLLQKLGEGGCGVVYLAEQEEPIRRRVALKIIRLGMDTREVIARFEAERQALARMDHPNIARVFDAGATGTGRPYFVMELIRGTRITDYCDQNLFTTSARLDLFIQVCHAIQHAHQKGVIHRDVKPSNILVALHDGVPVPKVIDFGIAKATQGRLTNRTLFTAFEQFVGTPTYMSPEQAELGGLDIDTRTDIYSLGVLLYELLTGQPPFDPKMLAHAGLDAMRNIIREVEPPKPSARLRMLGADALTTTAQRRQTDPARLIRGLRGDLDWIVMRCLEKDRTRRYETANELAGDVQRHLQDEPVAAGPPSRIYYLEKMVRRHRLSVGTVAAAALSLVVSLGVSTWMYSREKTARERAGVEVQTQTLLRQQAEAAQQKAEGEAEKAQQAAEFLSDLLDRAGPADARGRGSGLARDNSNLRARRVGAGGTAGGTLAPTRSEFVAGTSPTINISARARVGIGTEVLIAGFAVPGHDPAKVLIRGVGPGLAKFGVPDVLAQPMLWVYDEKGSVLAINTGWEMNTNATEIAAVASQVGVFALSPGSADCALLMTLPPGNYTAHVSGVNGTTGVAHLEVYQAPP